MKCSNCNKKEIYVQKRKLCCSCYNRLRKAGGLGELPKKTVLQARSFLANGLKNKYGNNLMQDLIALNDKPFATLTDVANKYGFTREYARQIYSKLFQKKFKPVAVLKTKKLKEQAIGCIHNPYYKVAEYKKGNLKTSAIYEKMFMDICIEHNYSISFYPKGVVDLVVNNNRVDVKFSSKSRMPSKRNKTGYYIYHSHGLQAKIADFFACYHPLQDSFFIIPNNLHIDKRGSINIYILERKSTYYNAKNRFWEYKNRFDLLHS